jgi:hypothetical protein
VLLRRVIEHVKTQNWTAVGLDFLIVVIGVFMGIQAQGWNADRDDHRLEHQYLVRLHDEVSELVNSNRTNVDYTVETLALLEGLGRHLVDNDESFLPTNQHCAAAARSHIFGDGIIAPTTIEELLSTGRILLISNDDIRSSVINFAQSIESIEQLRSDVQIERLLLARRYPDLITLGLNWNDSQCAFDKMPDNPEFINDFADNLFRYQGFTHGAILAQQELQSDLHAKLDQELGLSHYEVSQ